ncbi:MAG: hypothetical protein WCY05_05590 [Candidatus Omnitrophota bacterium]
MKIYGFIGLIAYLFVVLFFASCSPHGSVVYVGGLNNTEFHDSALFVDGVFFEDLSGGGVLKDLSIEPGTHTFTFTAKSGTRKELKVKVLAGENALEYDSKKKMWIWNFEQFPDLNGKLVIIE